MRAAIAALGIVFTAGDAMAGQLMIEDYGVADAGAAYVATVVKLGPKRKIELLVERALGERAKQPAGATVTGEIYGGVEWTDPRKSPIDQRLRGGGAAVKVSERTIAVPLPGRTDVFELMAASEANLRKVSVLLDPAARASYDATPAPALEVDLRDPDLAPLALAALTARGPIRAAVLLAADREVLDKHYAALDLAGRRRFLDELAPMATDAAARGRVLDLVERHFAGTPLASLVPFTSAMDAARKGDEQEMSELRVAMIGAARGKEPVDLSPLAAVYGAYLRARQTWLMADGELGVLTAKMDAPAKVLLARSFLEGVHASTQSRGGVDLFLLESARVLAAEAPDASLLDALAGVDPMRVRTTGTQETITGAVLSIATSVVTRSPASAQRAAEVVLPLLDHRAPASKEAAAAFRALVKGAKPAERARWEVELAHGTSRYLPGGVRVAYLEDGFSIDTRNDTGRTLTVSPGAAWYREGWEEPWSWTAGAERGGAVSVSLERVKRELGEEPELLRIARAAGCGDGERWDLEGWNGVFYLYGERCTVVVGAYTRRVVRK